MGVRVGEGWGRERHHTIFFDSALIGKDGINCEQMLTLASSKPSISVSKVERLYSRTLPYAKKHKVERKIQREKK